MPVLLAGREREIRRACAAGEGADDLCGAVSDYDCRHGMPGEWSGRDRRRRPGIVVRSDDREFEEEGPQARQLAKSRAAISAGWNNRAHTKDAERGAITLTLLSEGRACARRATTEHVA